LALYWSIRAASLRWRPALILSVIGLLIGYLGWSRIHLNASKTVNGDLVWSINSEWFFLGAMVLGACSLALALWKCKKPISRPAAAPTIRPVGSSGDESGVPPNADPAVSSASSAAQKGPPSVS
jgi:hypothetical protein